MLKKRMMLLITSVLCTLCLVACGNNVNQSKMSTSENNSDYSAVDKSSASKNSNSMSSSSASESSKQSSNENNSNNNAENKPLTDETKIELIVYFAGAPGNKELLQSSDDNQLKNFYMGKTDDVYGVGFGTAISDVHFKMMGDKIDYWVVDESSGEPTYKAPMKHTIVSLADLQKQFYNTPSQKQLVDQLSNKIKMNASNQNN